MNSFAANYIKQRTSNLTNMNASIITNKRQAQTIFTGYEKQIVAIEQKVISRPVTIFCGADGPAISNLKNGAIFTNPVTLNAIQNSS